MATSNQFVSLAFPSGLIGAASDVSGLSPEKTVIIAGTFTGPIIIEGSTDGGSTFQPVAQSNPSSSPVKLEFTAVFDHMRVRRTETGVAVGAVSVGAPVAAEVNTFSALTLGNGSNAGTAVDTSTGGMVRTFQTSGTYSGEIVIEGSLDNTNFVLIAFLRSAQEPVTFAGSFKSIRARRSPTFSGSATVSFGSGTLNVAPGGGADWSLSGIRYFLLDYDGGDDNNLGYIDSTAGATLAPTGLALKTAERLFQIMPRNGNARQAVVLIKNRAAGATYLKQDGVTSDNLDFTGFTSYSYLLRRGSTDLTNSATDKIALGAIQGQVGPGTGGIFTASAAGASGESVTIAVGAFTVEPALLGMRVRFTGNVTAALANVCTMIALNSTTVITFGSILPVAAAIGDTFTVERPGVTFARYKEADLSEAAGYNHANTDIASCAVGILTNANDTRQFIVGCGGKAMYAFCEQTGSAGRIVTNSDLSSVRISGWYQDESASLLFPGPGARIAGTLVADGLTEFIYLNSSQISTATTAKPVVTNVMSAIVGGGCTFGKGIFLGGPLSGLGSDTALEGVVPLISTVPVKTFGYAFFDPLDPSNDGRVVYLRPRIVSASTSSSGGAITLFQSGWNIYGVTFQAASNTDLIRVYGSGVTVTVDDCVNGSGARTGSVLNMSSGAGQGIKCNILWGTRTANTVTSTGAITNIKADMEGAQGTSLDAAGLTTADWIDQLGNHYIGTFGVTNTRLIAGTLGTLPELASDPADTPQAGYVYIWLNTTDFKIKFRNSAGTLKSSAAFT